jgi:hypothetical protein
MPKVQLKSTRISQKVGLSTSCFIQFTRYVCESYTKVLQRLRCSPWPPRQQFSSSVEQEHVFLHIFNILVVLVKRSSEL